jgi:hypothetical protein
MSTVRTSRAGEREVGSMDRAIRYWWVWTIAALGAGALTTAAAQGFPIVELELAGTVARADAAVAGADLTVIRTAIVTDFLFIITYAPALFFGSLWASRRFSQGLWRSIGPVVAVGGLVAGGLDVIENLAMLGYLNGWGGWQGWPTLSAAMAVPKFILAFIAIVYIVVGIVVAGIQRVSRRREGPV